MRKESITVSIEKHDCPCGLKRAAVPGKSGGHVARCGCPCFPPAWSIQAKPANLVYVTNYLTKNMRNRSILSEKIVSLPQLLRKARERYLYFVNANRIM
jgi:hypothetical protein